MTARFVRTLLALLASAAASLTLVAGCGAEEKKPAEPVEFEETLGFSGEGSSSARAGWRGRSGTA